MPVWSNQPSMGKADAHVHTKYSGLHRMGVLRFPESVSEPRDVIVQARTAGMDVVCITDHNSIKGALKAREIAKAGRNRGHRGRGDQHR